MERPKGGAIIPRQAAVRALSEEHPWPHASRIAVGGDNNGVIVSNLPPRPRSVIACLIWALIVELLNHHLWPLLDLTRAKLNLFHLSL